MKPDDLTRRLLNGVVIQTYSTGECRAHVRARLTEIAQGDFEIRPIEIKIVSGPSLPWAIPRRDAPISTRQRVTTLDQAGTALIEWANQVVELWLAQRAVERRVATEIVAGIVLMGVLSPILKFEQTQRLLGGRHDT